MVTKICFVLQAGLTASNKSSMVLYKGCKVKEIIKSQLTPHVADYFLFGNLSSKEKRCMYNIFYSL